MQRFELIKLSAFPPRPVQHLRLNVEWAVMHTGDSNAVSISSLALYDSPVIASAEPLPVCEVRFGTRLGKALSAADLPRQLPVILADGTRAMAEAVWMEGTCRPDIPGDYPVRGTLFVPGVANPGNIHAAQIIRVKPKDMTTPPDKAALDRAYQGLQVLVHKNADPAVRNHLKDLLTQAESFYALTGAVQHDVDVWTEWLTGAAAELEEN